MKKLAWILLLNAFFLTQNAHANVKFDGLTWYHSEDPKRLILNEYGQLEWIKPRGPDQITVKLPEMDLSKVGDIAEIIYMFKADGIETGVIGTDPTIISGTGDLRVGLFDSNGKGHIDSDNTGYTNITWCGYLGYCARLSPFLKAGIKREHSDAIPGKYMKRTGAMGDNCHSLMSAAGSYGKSQDLSGFSVPLNTYTPMILRIVRTTPDTLVFTVTMNGYSYDYVDDDPELQPKKIDAMALYYPNPKSITKITLAGCYFSCKPNTSHNKPIKK